MRVFVSEFLIGGACIGSYTSASMRREGLSMLQAVTEDLARLPDVSVVTTAEMSVTSFLVGEVIRTESAAQEQTVFERLLRETDAVLVIAPETDGILAQRCRKVCAANIASWNCSPSAIDLCGDKLKLAEHLQLHGLNTIPTKPLDFSRPDDETMWPRVLKPRDGAGSTCTFLIKNDEDYARAAQAFRQQGIEDKCLVQPFTEGRPLSIAVSISLDGSRMECLPIAEQCLSNDGRFRYLGGKIPADIPSSAHHAIEAAVLSACRSIPGLRGYVGIDVLLPTEGQPVIVEINPRLTTSYVGYRQLFSERLPGFWLSPVSLPKRMQVDFVEFDA